MSHSVSKARSLARLQNQPSTGPKRAFRITFMPKNKTIEVCPVSAEGHHEGLAGSVLDFALNHEINIDHACGGFAACSTCHVIIKQGLETCNDISDEEDEMLDEAPGLTLNSRLACQCVPVGGQDVVVEIPSWNRNLAREPH